MLRFRRDTDLNRNREVLELTIDASFQRQFRGRIFCQFDTEFVLDMLDQIAIAYRAVAAIQYQKTIQRVAVTRGVDACFDDVIGKPLKESADALRTDRFYPACISSPAGRRH